MKKTLGERFENGDTDFTKEEFDSLIMISKVVGKDLVSKPLPLIHIMAGLGFKIEDTHPCIDTRDEDGNTVAHVMAQRGYRFDSSSLAYNFKNNDGVSVADVMAYYAENNKN